MPFTGSCCFCKCVCVCFFVHVLKNINTRSYGAACFLLCHVISFVISYRLTGDSYTMNNDTVHQLVSQQLKQLGLSVQEYQMEVLEKQNTYTHGLTTNGIPNKRKGKKRKQKLHEIFRVCPKTTMELVKAVTGLMQKKKSFEGKQDLNNRYKGLPSLFAGATGVLWYVIYGPIQQQISL